MTYPLLIHQESDEYTLWLQIIEWDGDCFAVELLTEIPDSFNEEDKQSWLSYTLDMEGAEGLLDIPYQIVNYTHNISKNIGAAQFMLQNGILPEHPFCIRAGYWWTKSWEGEYDSGITYDLLYVTPTDPIKVADFWEQWAKEYRDDVDAQIAYRRALDEMQWTDVDSMFLRGIQEWRFGYDETMGPIPTGYSLALVTSRSDIESSSHSKTKVTRALLTERIYSNQWITPDEQECLKQRLFNTIREQMPHVDPSLLRIEMKQYY